jgi:glycosyltransferase involved in cell wall biosynthesis
MAMKAKTKVLHVLHNHPSLRAGAPETYVLELFEAMRGLDGLAPTLLARMGSEDGVERRQRPGAPIGTLNGDPDQFLVYIPSEGFDFFHMTYTEKSMYTRYFAEFLRAHQPDVVHFHHSLYVGCELISLVRYLLPAAAIVYTLHDYSLICHRDGRFVRTGSEALCMQASPLRCHECFPDVADEDFFLRTRFIQAHLNHVDRFVAPSRFLLERYVDWGIAPERIVLEEYGRPPAQRAPDSRGDRPRTRLGFFGDADPYAGLEVLEGAMAMLAAENVDVTLVTGRDRTDLPQLMSQVDWVVVPSRWWEASPLAVQDAFLHGRPVICSGIGAMAEKVEHAVNGLHFAVGDPRALADAIRDAVTRPGLWDRLAAGIPPVRSMEEHVDELMHLYRSCLERTDRAPALALE